VVKKIQCTLKTLSHLTDCKQKKIFFYTRIEQWPEMPIVEKRRAEKATRNAGDIVAKCEERTTLFCVVGFQTVRHTQ
jgi:hypothetical protein